MPAREKGRRACHKKTIGQKLKKMALVLAQIAFPRPGAGRAPSMSSSSSRWFPVNQGALHQAARWARDDAVPHHAFKSTCYRMSLDDAYRHVSAPSSLIWYLACSTQFLGVQMENSIFDLADLAALLGRSTQTIKKDIQRNRLAVPPRLHIPGTRLLRWRRYDVDAWLASYVESRPATEGR